VKWQRPTPSDVWKAIGIYLKEAYDGQPGGAVLERLEGLRQASGAGFYDSDAFEHEEAPMPARFSLRLGNRFYPHMKLVIERAPDGRGHLFRADTHDRHICPSPESREYAVFCELMARNQAVAQAIEDGGEKNHLPTFKTYLRNDLERRKGST